MIVQKYLRYFFTGLIFWLLTIPVSKVHGTHLMGGELTYLWSGTVGTYTAYEIKLVIYRYCDSTGNIPAPLDQEMSLGVFTQDLLNPNDPKAWFQTDKLILVGTSVIQTAPNV